MSILYIMDIFEYWKNDTDLKKPKRFKKGMTPTKVADKYNLSLLKAGAVKNTYTPKKIYNPETKRFLTQKQIKTDKSGKVSKVKIGKKFQSVNIKNNIIKNLVPLYKEVINNPPINSLKVFLNNADAKQNTPYRLMILDPEGFVIIDKLINLGDKSISSWWKANDKDYIKYVSGLYMPIWEQEIEEFIPEDQDEIELPEWNITFILTKEIKLSPTQIKQSFLDGVNHCVFTPIIDYFQDKLENTKSKDCRIRCGTVLNKIYGKKDKEGYLSLYSKGVPEDHLDKVCNDLGVGMDIEQPFTNNTFISIRPLKKAKKVFKFINTRLNHIEENKTPYRFDNLLKNDDCIYVDRKQLEKVYNDNRSDCIVCKRNDGICSVKTPSAHYVLPNDFSEAIMVFESETGLDKMNIDALKEPELQHFINLGTHFNLTIDFVDTFMYKGKIVPKNVRHIDIKKAYTQFRHSKYYEGFVGHITHFRKVDNYDKNGLYYIIDLDLSKCNKAFIKINNVMSWFHNDNIYTDAELRALKDNGGDFKVIYGAYGKRFDFEFDEAMINNKEETYVGQKTVMIPYYSKYCGFIASLQPTKSFYMYGDHKYFQDIQSKCEYNIWRTEGTDEYRITYDKKHIYNKKHITAQITAYQRLNILEQLLNMNVNKIIRVCVDGIYYYDHDFKMNDIYCIKDDKKSFNNEKCDSYLSGINYREISTGVKRDWLEDINGYTIPKDFTDWNADFVNGLGDAREYYDKMIYDGAGGNGKTHLNLTDKGLKSVIYVAPSWKLATSKYKEYGVASTVLYRLLEKPYRDDFIGKYGVMLIDEASQITEKQKQIILKNYGYRSIIIFLGDLGFQLPPIDNNGTEMNRDGLKVITLQQNYRFKDEDIKEVVKYLRECINDNKSCSMKYLKSKIKCIHIDAVKDLYKKEDIILVSENKYGDEYTNRFDFLEKYKVKENTRVVKNGEIVFDKIEGVKMDLQHGFTIHSVQGETFKERIFIDMRKMKSKRMLYTAISRANYLNQVYFIN